MSQYTICKYGCGSTPGNAGGQPTRQEVNLPDTVDSQFLSLLVSRQSVGVTLAPSSCGHRALFAYQATVGFNMLWFVVACVLVLESMVSMQKPVKPWPIFNGKGAQPGFFHYAD